MKNLVNKISLFAAILLLCSTTVLAGGRDGGGGLAIACEGGENTQFPQLDQKRFPKSGYYLYDYVISGKKIDEWYVTDKDPDKHLQLLKMILIQNVPLHFYEYVPDIRDYLKANSRNLNMNFIPLPLGFTLNNTESVDASRIPPNCDKNSVKQVVTYKNGGYHYDPNLLSSLQEIDKVKNTQVLGLYTHELLRVAYPTGNMEMIVRWTIALHNKKIASKEQEAFLLHLLKNGISIDKEANTIVKKCLFKKGKEEKNEQKIVNCFSKELYRAKESILTLNKIGVQLEVINEKCSWYDTHKSELLLNLMSLKRGRKIINFYDEVVAENFYPFLPKFDFYWSNNLSNYKFNHFNYSVEQHLKDCPSYKEFKRLLDEVNKQIYSAASNYKE